MIHATTDDAPTGRDPRPGEDWSLARCSNLRTSRYFCAFCAERIRGSRRGYTARLGGERAHYACAPGLGRSVVPIEPAGALVATPERVVRVFDAIRSRVAVRLVEIEWEGSDEEVGRVVDEVLDAFRVRRR